MQKTTIDKKHSHRTAQRGRTKPDIDSIDFSDKNFMVISFGSTSKLKFVIQWQRFGVLLWNEVTVL